ncbi:MAG: hypothetical protein NZ571_04830 [Anaerolineae bacterium]|nr:hypothetical protein [Anaerolineae bacterium]
MKNSAALILALAIVALIALWTALSLLPPPPLSPTPTFPLGIDLPEKLPRIPR